MKKIFLLTFSIFVTLWGTYAYTIERVSPEVERVDRKIHELEDMKRGFLSRALRHENQAERLQFDDQAVLETRRHLQIAEENRQKADYVQQEIDTLKARRVELIKEGK